MKTQIQKTQTWTHKNFHFHTNTVSIFQLSFHYFSFSNVDNLFFLNLVLVLPRKQKTKKTTSTSFQSCTVVKKKRELFPGPPPTSQSSFELPQWFCFFESLRPGSGILTLFPFDRTVKCVIESPLHYSTNKFIKQWKKESLLLSSTSILTNWFNPTWKKEI